MPVPGQEPDSMFVVLKTDQNKLSAHLFEDGDNRQVGQLEVDYGTVLPHWADRYILLAGHPNSWLVPLRRPRD